MPAECAVSLTKNYKYYSPYSASEKIKINKTFPTAHHRVKKTTKFSPTIIALGNMRAKCSPKDLQEAKQFPQHEGRGLPIL